MLPDDSPTLIATWTIAAVFWAWVTVLAVWTALGRGSAVIRVATGLTPAGLLWWIGARELIPVFLVQWSTVAVSMALWRRSKSQVLDDSLDSPRAARILPTFSLRAVLISVAAFGLLWKAFVNWPDATLLAGAATTAGLVSVYAVFSRHWLSVRFLICLLGLFAAWVATCAYIEDWSDAEWVATHPDPTTAVLGLAPLLSMLLTVSLLKTAEPFVVPSVLKYPLMHRAPDFSAERWKKKWRLAAFGMVWIPLAIIACSVFYILISPAPIPPPSTSDTTQYQEIVRLGKLVSLAKNKFHNEMTIEELRPHIERNRPLLAEVRQRTAKPSSVPFDCPGGFDMDLAGSQSLRVLAQAFHADIYMAEQEGRLSDAAESCLDILRYSQTARRDGLRVHHLVGIAIEGIGLAELEKLHSRLNTGERRHVAVELHALESTFPSTDRMGDFEAAWTDRQFWSSPLDRRLDDWFVGWSRSMEVQIDGFTQRNLTALKALTEKCEANP